MAAAPMQVERQGDVWVQPSDGAVCHVMRRRYVLQAQCADFSGQAYIQFFNDQAWLPSCCPLIPWSLRAAGSARGCSVEAQQRGSAGPQPRPDFMPPDRATLCQSHNCPSERRITATKDAEGQLAAAWHHKIWS